jgi:hypothetical protein
MGGARFDRVLLQRVSANASKVGERITPASLRVTAAETLRQ